MKAARIKVFGWLLVLGGILIVAFSNKIVFPGLEILLGIETLVGKSNVVYLEGGGYLYTNPGAMMQWIASVAFIGVLIGLLGIWLIFQSRARKPD